MANENTTPNVEQAYKNLTILLTRSLVIKSSVHAELVNATVRSKFGEAAVDKDNPWSWKYYMNIAGQYHPTDTVMKVISLDTGVEIEFTTENMIRHTATAEAYRYGSRYYFALVAKYPDQRSLILSITNPANISTAINSKDGTILAYYQDLVEPQEDQLIRELQEYVYSFLRRGTTIGFNRIWKYYPVALWSMLCFNIPAHIVNIRALACKTERAHTHHIRQYLASHGRLDKYLPYMTLKQALYIYMNIDYIQRNAGRTEMFNELVKWILDERRIPLMSFTVRQLQTFDDQKFPDLTARRVAVGTRANSVESEYVTMETYFEKEEKVRAGTPQFYIDKGDQVIIQTKESNSSVIQTKDLESAMVDYTNSVPDPLPEVMMRQWAFMSSHGMYNVMVNFVDPMTGEDFSITAREALIYFSYVWLRSRGQEVHEIPTFINVKYRRHPRPVVEELYQDIPDIHQDMRELADQLVVSQPILVDCTSVRQFNLLTTQIYEECLNHWFIKGGFSDPMRHGIAKSMINRLFGIEHIEFNEPLTMGEWLAERNLPHTERTLAQSEELMKVIFYKATGYVVDDTKSMRSIQRAMIGLFTQLSSYSIQVMREINDTDIIPVGGSEVYLGVEGDSPEMEAYIEAPVRIIDTSTVPESLVEGPVAPVYVYTAHTDTSQDVSVEAGVDVYTKCPMEIYVDLIQPAIRVSIDESVKDESSPFAPVDALESLEDWQVAMIVEHMKSPPRKLNNG